MVYVDFFGGKNIRVYPLKFFARKVARGNAEQISSNFPAKSLGIKSANF